MLGARQPPQVEPVGSPVAIDSHGRQCLLTIPTLNLLPKSSLLSMIFTRAALVRKPFVFPRDVLRKNSCRMSSANFFHLDFLSLSTASGFGSCCFLDGVVGYSFRNIILLLPARSRFSQHSSTYHQARRLKPSTFFFRAHHYMTVSRHYSIMTWKKKKIQFFFYQHIKGGGSLGVNMAFGP